VDGCGLIHSLNALDGSSSHAFDWSEAIAGSLPENEDPRTFLVNARGVLPGGMFSSEPMSKLTPISCTHWCSSSFEPVIDRMTWKIPILY
jgi:hypothetical protein